MINHFNEKSFHSTDQKGRLLLPKDVREAYDIQKTDTLYLIPNLSEPAYLEIRTESQWGDYCRTLREQDAGEKKKDSYRYAMMFRETASVDGQGRIVLSQRLRDTCGLNGDVAVIDMDVCIEVWSRGNMEQKYTDMIKAFKDANQKMF